MLRCPGSWPPTVPFPPGAAGNEHLHRLPGGPRTHARVCGGGKGDAIKWAGRDLCVQSVDAPFGHRVWDHELKPVMPLRVSWLWPCGLGETGQQGGE